MASTLARFLSLLLTTVQGAQSVSVVPGGVHLADRKPGQLFGAGHGEPEYDDVDAIVSEDLFEGRGLAEEAVVLIIRAESHDAFTAGAVVPGAVVHGDFACGRGI